MTESTSSSISIAAEPGAVLDVIADFEAYPDWAEQVKSVSILSEDGDGWADQVEYVLDAGAVKDTYVLEYDWDGIAEDGSGLVSWKARAGRGAQGARRLLHAHLGRRRHEGGLRPCRRREDPDDRDAQAQGGEGSSSTRLSRRLKKRVESLA